MGAEEAAAEKAAARQAAAAAGTAEGPDGATGGGGAAAIADGSEMRAREGWARVELAKLCLTEIAPEYVSLRRGRRPRGREEEGRRGV